MIILLNINKYIERLKRIKTILKSLFYSGFNWKKLSFSIMVLLFGRIKNSTNLMLYDIN